jgi:transcriptional regulator
MLEQPLYALEEQASVADLIARHGWVTLVTGATAGPVVSHLPVIPDPAGDGLSVLGHLARPDADAHELGEHDVVVIVQGPHGYVSPTFYEAGPYVPTWNFVVAHLHGRPELLTAEETYDVLSATVDHFEAARPQPWRMASAAGYAQRIAPGTTGFRLVPSRVVGKAKLSQDKPAEIVGRVIRALETDPVHGDAALAAAMRQHLGAGPS